MITQQISKSVSNISPSATEKTSFLANQMRRRGIDIISFAQGEPDFDTPEHIKQASIKALNEGFTNYTDVPGIPELKDAVSKKFKRENNVLYDPAEIIVSSGAKQALYEVFKTLLDPGDEVLIPSPCYVSYAEQIKLSGGVPVFIRTQEKNNFRTVFEEVRDGYRDNVKAFVINSPNNPTGAVIQKDELQKMADFLIERNVYLITDEVYEHILYEDMQHVSVASLGEKIKNHSIIVNSLSKTYAMTGWRVGYAAGPKEVIQAVGNFQGHSSGNINSIAQKAAITALIGDQQPVRDMVKEYAKRRAYMVDRLNQIPGFRCQYPDGAFYAFPNVMDLYGKKYDGKVIESDLDVATFFLEKAHVAVVPGVAFNYSGYVRFVFAKSMDEIEDGLNRIEEAIELLS